MKVGYARVSTKGQTSENQISEMAETGCELFFEEKTSGAKKRRPALEAVLEQIRADDIVGVTSLDRLTRSTPELLRIAEVFIKRTGNCSPLIQAPKTQQQFPSQLLRHDASFTFGCGDSNRLLLILSLRLSFSASFVQSGSTAREFMT